MTLQIYKKLMTTAFRDNTRRGFADWRNCGYLYRDVTDGLETAREMLCEEGRYADLFALCNWTFVKWERTEKDDSNGETQDFCACVYDIWETIYRDGEQSISHTRMLNTLLKHLDGRITDLEDIIYDFILDHFKSKNELARKEAFLLQVMDDLKKQCLENDVRKYSLYVIEDYYVRVLADQRRPIEEIRTFFRTRDHFIHKDHWARIEADYGNLEEAIALYKEMIAERPDAYWSDEPRKALMEIYKTQGNTEAYNEELYRMALAHPREDTYYLEYKALFSDDEWKTRWEKILAKFAGRLFMINCWLNIEGRYDLIMTNAEPDNEHIIYTYGEQLFKLYPERCFEVLKNAADRQVQNSGNRREYRYIAKILKKIASFPGGKEIAADLAAKYRAQYPRRTAMHDELKKF